MITKGVAQEQKPSVLFSMPDLATNFGSSSSDINIFKRDFDFNKIDYLIFSTYARLSIVTGTGYIKLDIGGSNKANHSFVNSAGYENNYTRIDCTAISGNQTVEIYTDVESTADLIGGGIYLGVVDA